MYSIKQHEFVPVPNPETPESKKLTHFTVRETVYVKGMAFTVLEIKPRQLVLVPVDHS